MKKLLLLLQIILLTSLPISTIYAEEETTREVTTQYFNLSISKGLQSAWDKSITYTVTITPQIDSEETQILWDAPTAIDITPRHSEFVDLTRGETYTFNAKVRPERSGSYEISVNVISWQHDTNYTNSVSDIITFDSNLLVSPQDPNYIYAILVKYLIIFVFVGLLTWGVIFFSKKGLKSLKKWLTPPK
ncbi:MAG: hypothetical protein PHP08_03710 [Candidatus Dojkabacteria bacterium]|nr:hypothetical protein [Candidatus Dojkabacteria bacterium]